MNVHYSKKLPHAFVVRPDKLKKLVELFQNHVGKVAISVKCADGFSREFKTVKELIGYENSKSKEIRYIRLSARSDNYSKSASVDFAGGLFQRGVSIDFEACEELVFQLRDKTHSIVEGMRPWYSWMSRINFEFTALAIFFIFYLVVRQVRLWWPVLDQNIKPWVLIIILFLFIILLITASFFGKKLFPPTAFTIGQGESRFKVLEKIRWGLVIAFFVSFGAGLVLLGVQIFLDKSL